MMKRKFLVVVAAMALSGGATIALADTAQNNGPEIINLKMGDTSLAFQHWKHQKQLKGKNDCFRCHKVELGKIEGWGTETAHTVCIPCHDLNDKGPVECKGCHKKK